MKLEMLDTFGVPEFYSDRIGSLEDAGNGMVRAVRCIERKGVLIPVFSYITPAVCIMKDALRFREIAEEIVCREMADSFRH